LNTNGKHFGLATLTFLVVANMIGAGVFITSGFALHDLGTPGRVVLAWIVGGLIAIAGALSYGQLARAMPESGGEYLFLSRAAHPLLGFVAGWVSLIAGFTGAIALAATALESYLIAENSRPTWLPPDAVAIAAVMLGGLCHGIQARAGALWQNVAVVLKLSLLILFLLVATFQLPSREISSAAGPTADAWSQIQAFAISLVWISLSYAGFNAAVYIAGEAADAERTVPRALLLGTSITAILYIGLNAVFVYGPEPTAIAGKEDVAVIAANAIGGSRLASFVLAIISIALMTSVMSMMMAGPRVYAKMADDGLLPAWLRSGISAPRTAILLQVVLAAVIISVSTLNSLLSYLGLTLSVCGALSVGCLFLPSVRSRPLLHVGSLPPLIYIVSTLAAGSFMAAGKPQEFLATIATFAVGAAAYLLIAKRSPRVSV
jgi:APA family basic amino acid/polyamine antiporter